MRSVPSVFPIPVTRWCTLVALAAFLLSCEAVPITGRSQLSLVPQSTINSAGLDAYRDFRSKHKVSTDAKQTEAVRRVGSRLQQAVTRYFTQAGQSSRLEGYQWEFTLVESPEVNAFCLPGGKVVVYTGILPITQNDDGLAVVMGHEIAHAVANHGSERVSQALLTQAGGLALSQFLSTKPETTRDVVMQTYGIGAQVGVMLPYSRVHELEADRLGTIFMAMAGYDPNGAVGFWQRMAAQGKGKPPEFLSTHPADETRINNIRKIIPEAMRYKS